MDIRTCTNTRCGWIGKLNLLAASPECPDCGQATVIQARAISGAVLVRGTLSAPAQIVHGGAELQTTGTVTPYDTQPII